MFRVLPELPPFVGCHTHTDCGKYRRECDEADGDEGSDGSEQTDDGAAAAAEEQPEPVEGLSALSVSAASESEAGPESKAGDDAAPGSLSDHAQTERSRQGSEEIEGGDESEGEHDDEEESSDSDAEPDAAAAPAEVRPVSCAYDRRVCWCFNQLCCSAVLASLACRISPVPCCVLTEQFCRARLLLPRTTTMTFSRVLRMWRRKIAVAAPSVTHPLAHQASPHPHRPAAWRWTRPPSRNACETRSAPDTAPKHHGRSRAAQGAARARVGETGRCMY
jgi:hypothetical protein